MNMHKPLSGGQVGRSVQRLESKQKVSSGRAEYVHNIQPRGCCTQRRREAPWRTGASLALMYWLRGLSQVCTPFSSGEDICRIFPSPYFWAQRLHDQACTGNWQGALCGRAGRCRVGDGSACRRASRTTHFCRIRGTAERSLTKSKRWIQKAVVHDS